MRAPKVLAVTQVAIRTRRRGAEVRFHRWYVTFDFGGVTKKLVISDGDAQWMQGQPARCEKCKRPTRAT